MQKATALPFSNTEANNADKHSLEHIMEELNRAEDQCSHPPALDDLALIAAIDGEASLAIADHLRACGHCAARADQFAHIQGLLRKRLFRLFCPTADDLAAFQQRRLTAEQRANIAQHLGECPHCARELHLLEQISHPAPDEQPPLSLRNPLSSTAPPSQRLAAPRRQIDRPFAFAQARC